MELSDQARRFLDVINANAGQWLTRRQIAGLVGKKRLNPYEIAALDLLTEQKLIDRQEVKVAGAIGFQYNYRAHENG